jgi:ferrous iron transport protein B
LWILGYFPRSADLSQQYELKRQVVEQSFAGELQKEKLLQIDQEEAGAFLENSYMGKMGKAIEPAIAPMGFDWKMGVGVLTAFAAREIFVSTMGIVYHLGDVDEESAGLREKLRSAKKPDGTPAYTLRTAIALMLFFVFAAQCMSTLAVIRRETGGNKWAVISFVYMTALAYAAATAAYQGLGMLGWA